MNVMHILKPGNEHKKLSPHFTEAEFRCKCDKCQTLDCTILMMLVKALEHLRVIVDKPVHVHCGFRCVDHNTKVGGAKKSYHLSGMAADIHVEGYTSEALASILRRIHIGGVGVYPWGVHVDVGPKREFTGK